MEGLKIRVILLLLGILFISLFVSAKMTEGFQGNGSNFGDIRSGSNAGAATAAAGATAAAAATAAAGFSPPIQEQAPAVQGQATAQDQAPPAQDQAPAQKQGQADTSLTSQSVDHIVGKVTDHLGSYASSILKSYLNMPVVPNEGFTSLPFATY